MKPIPNWRQAWRLWSVRVSAFGAVLFAFLLAAPDQVQAIWNALPPDVQAAIPNSKTLALAISVAVTIARVLQQRERSDGSR
ncbi:hypothetical protein KV697_10915 [Sphingomonas sanguinis]|uniref:DUF7940 domain-containing protein n=1 Tax=Sphingomonas sanguinis TaxID=33051 RepID=UPI001C56C51D|nr:hypothetical protein [Sphingomonas sanguinis]QXT34345.1 hypothetical protein KV697_10915 [Sphingomonas sanguinis]